MSFELKVVEFYKDDYHFYCHIFTDGSVSKEQLRQYTEKNGITLDCISEPHNMKYLFQSEAVFFCINGKLHTSIVKDAPLPLPIEYGEHWRKPITEESQLQVENFH